MLAKVDIPDETYLELRLLAAQRGGTFEDLVLEGLELIKQTSRTPTGHFEIPTIPSDCPGSLDLTSEQIYDLIGFP
jgi:hypothetical protein